MHEQSARRNQLRISRRQALRLGAAGAAALTAGLGGSLLWGRRVAWGMLGPPVVALTPWLVNSYLVRGARPVLVDAGFPADAPAIEEALRTTGVRPEEVGLILVTHGHYDHFGGAAALRNATGAPVAVHALEAQRLRDGRSTPVVPLTATGRLLARVQAEARSPAPVTPDWLLVGGERLDAYGVAATIVHTPGHTAGSLSLVVGEIALIGDLLAGSLAYPNQPDEPFFIDRREDAAQIRTSLSQLLDTGVRIFLPGHGLPFNRAAALHWLAEKER